VQVEKRTFNADFTNNGNSLTGHASIFNSLSQDLPLPNGNGTFREVIRPHAFDNCLAQGADIRALVNHNPEKILGRTGAGTVKVVADDRGLQFTVQDLPNTTYANDLKESMKRGDIKECSFAFTIAKNGENWRRENDTVIREITDVDNVYDVSPVTFPAYVNTDCALRSFDLWLKEQAKPIEPEKNYTVIQAQKVKELDV
jgi:hypothetical protein